MDNKQRSIDRATFDQYAKTTKRSFAATQFLVSNYAYYRLTDVLSSLGSLIVTVLS
jgi:hypothetical protein